MKRQRRRTEHEEKVYRAVVKALTDNGLKYQTVAALVGIKHQTAREIISSGKFTVQKAARWSGALRIPMNVFLEGEEYIPENKEEKLYGELIALQKKVDQIQSEVNELKRWKNLVTGADDINKNP